MYHSGILRSILHLIPEVPGFTSWPKLTSYYGISFQVLLAMNTMADFWDKYGKIVPLCRLSFVFLDCSVAWVVTSVVTYTSCEYNTGTLLLSTDVDAGMRFLCRSPYSSSKWSKIAFLICSKYFYMISEVSVSLCKREYEPRINTIVISIWKCDKGLQCLRHWRIAWCLWFRKQLTLNVR